MQYIQRRTFPKRPGTLPDWAASLLAGACLIAPLFVDYLAWG